MPRAMTIGQLAKAAGVGVETIRYYQRRGILATPSKPVGGHRQYPASSLATLAFVRRGQVTDTLKIVEMLLRDPEDLIHKAVGGMLRAVGKDRPRLEAFLDRHAAEMPRVTLRYALEHFEPDRRAHYLALRVAS